MNSINTVNGVLVAAQSDFVNHVEDKTLHLTEGERETWNAKADASALSGKVDKAELTAHETNTTVHITDEEREKWNARNTKGAVVATQDGLDEHTENTTVHITEEERAAWNEAAAIPGVSNAFTGDNTHAGVETFNGPVVLNGPVIINKQNVQLPQNINQLTDPSQLVDSDAPITAREYKFIRQCQILFSGKEISGECDCSYSIVPGTNRAYSDMTIHSFKSGPGIGYAYICDGGFDGKKSEVMDGTGWLPKYNSDSAWNARIVVLMRSHSRAVVFLDWQRGAETMQIDEENCFVDGGNDTASIMALPSKNGYKFIYSYHNAAPASVTVRANKRVFLCEKNNMLGRYFSNCFIVSGSLNYNGFFTKTGMLSELLSDAPLSSIQPVLTNRSKRIDIEIPAEGGGYVYTAQTDNPPGPGYNWINFIGAFAVGEQNNVSFISVSPDTNRESTENSFDYTFTLKPNNSGVTRYGYGFVGNIHAPAQVIKFTQKANI